MATKKKATKRKAVESEAFVVGFTHADGGVTLFDKLHETRQRAQVWATENGWTRRVGGEVIRVRITEVIK